MTKKKTPTSESYDLWDTVDKEPTKDADEGLTHYLRQTGKLKPKFKSNYVHSVLPSVEVAKAGASYNPTVGDYMTYANKIAAEENVEIKKEEWVKRALTLRPGDTYCTPEERKREEEMGFFDSDSSQEMKEIKTEDEDEAGTSKERKMPKQKTIKQRRRQMELRLEELERLKGKRTRVQEAEVFRLKSILKEVKSELKTRADRTVANRRKRVLRKLVSTKRLGHGKYEEFKEPVLLPNEIKGNMRTLAPQGNILAERMKSLQKRNMLQPKSTKKQKQLKSNLKFKVTESREAREFMEEERLKLIPAQLSVNNSRTL